MSEPFRGIKCTFENIETIGKTKETKTTKEAKAKTIKNHKENKQNKRNQNFQTHVGQSGHGSESFVFVFLVSPMVFDSFCLGLFCCFGFFGFPYGFDVLKLLHCMFKRVPGNN